VQQPLEHVNRSYCSAMLMDYCACYQESKAHIPGLRHRQVSGDAAYGGARAGAGPRRHLLLQRAVEPVQSDLEHAGYSGDLQHHAFLYGGASDCRDRTEADRRRVRIRCRHGYRHLLHQRGGQGSARAGAMAGRRTLPALARGLSRLFGRPRTPKKRASGYARNAFSSAFTCAFFCRRKISSTETMSLSILWIPRSAMIRAKTSCMAVTEARMAWLP